MSNTEEKVVIGGRTFIVHDGSTTASRLLTYEEALNYEPMIYVNLT